MSILNYFRKIDKEPSDNDEGLKELLGPNVLKEANAELRRVIDSPEPGCSTGPSPQTKRRYNVYSQKKYCLINFLPSHNVLKIMDLSCIHFKTVQLIYSLVGATYYSRFTVFACRYDIA